MENVKEELTVDFDKKIDSMKVQLLKQIHDSQNFKFKKVKKKQLLKKAVPVILYHREIIRNNEQRRE